jgi:hypothetical protein
MFCTNAYIVYLLYFAHDMRSYICQHVVGLVSFLVVVKNENPNKHFNVLTQAYDSLMLVMLL